MKKLRYDVLLIAAVLLLSALLWLAVRPGGTGTWAVVTVGDREMGRYPLHEELTTTFGEEDYNILQISGGRVSVTEANCGDHTCIRTGEIFREGETIVCLPHKLIVTIVGGEASSFDAMAK